MSDSEVTQASADFVFGTLATDDLRLAQVRALWAGVAHLHRLEPPDPQEGEAVTVFVSVGPRIVADRVSCYYTVDSSEPSGQRGCAVVGMAVVCTRVEVVWDTLLWGYREVWAGVIPAQVAGTLVRYRIEAWSSQGGESHWAHEVAGVVYGERPDGVHPDDEVLAALSGQARLWTVRRIGSYAYHVDREQVPLWLRDAVIYHLFVDRFEPGDGHAFAHPTSLGGFFGGTLRGVIERLDYIRSLGVDCIWMLPVFPSPSHHGYDATDYGRVEPRLGSDDDLRALIRAAHARGMRVLLDYVVNHVSHEHPLFQEASRVPDSPKASWFTFTRWPDQYVSFFGVSELPQINSDSAGMASYMIRHACYWLEQGIDGFRLDYANGPSHAFWSMFRAATRAVHAESVTLGEVVETSALQRTYQGRMDGCLDFLLLQALRQFFAFGSLSVSGFDTFLRRHLAFFPADFVLPSFLDNHDMNRFLWVVGGDVRRLKLAALCQFTLPHPPVMYYGTEVGLSQRRDVRYADGSGHPEESRLPMLWGEQQDATLLTFYRQLGALRRATAGVWRGVRETLVIDDAHGVYVYRCADERRAAVVVVNNGADVRRVGVPDGAAYTCALASDGEVVCDDGVVVVPPFAGAIFLSAHVSEGVQVM